MASGLSGQWNNKNIDLVKAEVKSQLDSVEAESGPKARFAKIISCIRAREASTSPHELLELYVYIVSALIHHKKWGGLSDSQIKKMLGLAYSLLQIQGIQPETSTLGFLYGEIHMALSQIYRTNGDHFAAAWEQQVSHQVSKRSPPGGESYQSLAKAIRAFRLGQIDRAYSEYLSVESNNASPKNNERAMIGRIRCMRLKKNFEACKTLIDNLFEHHNISTKFALELEWELYCIHASQDANLEPMIKSIQKKGTHHQAVYIMEAFLWALAWPQRNWVERLPKMSTVARNKELGAKSNPFFLKAVSCLEDCQDSSIPFIIRIKALGNILKSSNEFLAIDRELLFYIASSRWLAKSHSKTLAATVLGEYEGLSAKITQGSSADVLNIAQDLMERSWFKTNKHDTAI